MRHVIITRPPTSVRTLAAEIIERGDCAYELPFFTIEPVHDKTVIQQLVNSAHTLDYVVFVSSHAVSMSHFPFADISKTTGKKPVAVAVGAATASAIQAYGYDNLIFPDDCSGAKAVLSMACFCQNLTGQRIGIVNGKGANHVLASEFRKRGAFVTEYACYRRCNILSSESIAAKIRQIAGNTAIDVIIVTTTSAMRQLGTAAKIWHQLYHIPVLVTHPHIASLSTFLGFSSVILSKPKNDDILNTLYNYPYFLSKKQT